MRDSGTDTGADVGETGIDAADANAKDVDLGEAAAGWRFFTELPGCDEQVPLNPKAALPILKWITCPSNTASCQQFDTTGWRGDGISKIFQTPQVSRDKQWLRFTRWLTVNDSETDIYSRSNFDPVNAWRYTYGGNCAVGPVLGTDNVLVQGHIGISQPWVYAVGSMPSAAVAPGPFRTPQPTPALAAAIALSGSTLALDQQLVPPAIIRMPLGTTSYMQTSNIKLFVPLVVGDDVFAHNEYGVNGWSREIRVNADGSTSAFREAANRHVSHFDSDGMNLFWTEAYGDANFQNFDQPYCEIWWAPYTNDPTTLASTAKKLAQIDGVRAEDQTQVAFDGYYAVVDRVHFAVYVVRAPDGAVKKLDMHTLFGTTSTGDAFMSEPAFVSKDEVWGVMQSAVAGVAFARFQLGTWP